MAGVFLVYVAGLIASAWCTLLERKLLAGAQHRKGPNKASLNGVLQPLADALNLFTKQEAHVSRSNSGPYFIAPPLSLAITLAVWHLWPIPVAPDYYLYGVLFFFCLSSVHVYTLLAAGWSSNCVYSIFGAIRGVSVILSYEIPLVIFFLSLSIQVGSWNFHQISLWGIYPLLLLNLVVMPVFVPLMVMEFQRAPYDLVEAESELVSGYNTEYSSTGFVLLFLAEYGSMVVGCQLIATLLLASLGWHMCVLGGLGLSQLILMARAAYPRVNTEMIMEFCWNSCLPLSLLHLILSFSFILS